MFRDLEEKNTPFFDQMPLLIALQKYTSLCNDSSAYNLLGAVYEKRGQYSEATDAYQMALKISSEEDSSKYMILSNYARALVFCERYEIAIDTLEKLKSINTNDVWIYVGLGIANYFLGQLQTSLENFEIALGLTEGVNIKNDITHLLAQILYALGHEEHIEIAKQQLFTT
jgi:tetratricopeptide (TPR) repeat protein